MKKILIILLVMALCMPAIGQSFRISKSSWLSKSGTVIKYDKAEHFAVSALIYLSMRIIGASRIEAALGTCSLGLVWEIKDGFMPWEKWGCYVDVDLGCPGPPYDNCVLQTGCEEGICAILEDVKYKKPEDCPYWRRIDEDRIYLKKLGERN